MLARPLHRAGLEALIAPALPLASGPSGFRGPVRSRTWLLRWLRGGAGGVAGGGVLEFDLGVAKHTGLVALVYLAKVLLSNISYA